ncbi:MAG: hypothetical protein IPF99_30885 [Deltaproteobacteria bacterium]|nr:hypothetical protein [Deltaproteobacteria bacterium]
MAAAPLRAAAPALADDARYVPRSSIPPGGLLGAMPSLGAPAADDPIEFGERTVALDAAPDLAGYTPRPTRWAAPAAWRRAPRGAARGVQRGAHHRRVRRAHAGRRRHALHRRARASRSSTTWRAVPRADGGVEAPRETAPKDVPPRPPPPARSPPLAAPAPAAEPAKAPGGGDRRRARGARRPCWRRCC